MSSIMQDKFYFVLGINFTHCNGFPIFSFVNELKMI